LVFEFVEMVHGVSLYINVLVVFDVRII
jgi:hypothetical protein